MDSYYTTLSKALARTYRSDVNRICFTLQGGNNLGLDLDDVQINSVCILKFSNKNTFEMSVIECALDDYFPHDEFIGDFTEEELREKFPVLFEEKGTLVVYY